MAFALKYVVVFLLLSMLTQGMCCNFGQIQIGTVRTGRYIAGQTEWKVTVLNTCNCLQRHVTLSCRGFSPLNPVEPWLLQPQGNRCALINGDALPPGSTAEFTYVGQPYIFRPVGSTVDPSCPN